MIEALHDQPKFSKFFADHLLSRNRKIEEDVIDQPSNSSGRELLTSREHMALAQNVRGASNKEAGRALSVVPRTGEFHCANIMQKLARRIPLTRCASALATMMLYFAFVWRRILVSVTRSQVIISGTA